MTPRKVRLTVTIDPELLEAGNRAVAAGAADSLSGWANDALSDRAARDQAGLALAGAVADYEAEFGEISAEEIDRQRRADREAALIVRGAAGAGVVDERGRRGGSAA